MEPIAVVIGAGAPVGDSKAVAGAPKEGAAGLFEAFMALELARAPGAGPLKKTAQTVTDPILFMMSALMQAAAVNQPITDMQLSGKENQPAEASPKAVQEVAADPQALSGSAEALLRMLAAAGQGGATPQQALQAGENPHASLLTQLAFVSGGAAAQQQPLAAQPSGNELMQAVAQLLDQAQQGPISPAGQLALEEIKALFMARLAAEPAAPQAAAAVPQAVPSQDALAVPGVPMQTQAMLMQEAPAAPAIPVQAQSAGPGKQAAPADMPAIPQTPQANVPQGQGKASSSPESGVNSGSPEKETAVQSAAPQERRDDATVYHAAARAAHVNPPQAPDVRSHEHVAASVRPGSDAFESVVQSIAGLKDAAVKEMQIHLKPEFLGKVVIHLTMEEGGLVARIAAANPRVQDAFMSQAASLQSSLAEQGLKDVRVVVTSASVQDPGLQQQAEGRRNQRESHDRRRGREAVESVESQSAQTVLAYGQLYKPGSINYLA